MKYLFLALAFGLTSLVLLFAATSIAPELPVRVAESSREFAGQMLLLASLCGFGAAFVCAAKC